MFTAWLNGSLMVSATSRYNYDRNESAYSGDRASWAGKRERERYQSCEMKKPNNSLHRTVPPGLLLKLELRLARMTPRFTRVRSLPVRSEIYIRAWDRTLNVSRRRIPAAIGARVSRSVVPSVRPNIRGSLGIPIREIARLCESVN